MSAVHKLIRSWRKCTFDSSPHFFSGDEFLHQSDFEDSVCVSQSFDAFIKSGNFETADRRLHINLLPIPYVGNLNNASVYVLMSNPGLSNADYYAEDNSTEFRGALIRNIRQQGIDDKFPFLFLNPCFAWHPGFRYWHGKLKGFARAISVELGLGYQTALSHLAQRFACLELVPYHSVKFPHNELVEKLASVRSVIAFVHDIVVPKAERGHAMIIVARGNDFWKLRPREDIIVYEGFESRSAHLTPKTKKVGRRIAERLALKSIL